MGTPRWILVYVSGSETAAGPTTSKQSGLNRFGDPIRQAVDLDDTDRRILRILGRNARLSSRAIAREIGMSPGSISDRIGRLEREGVIRGYRAQIDPSTFGLGMAAIVGLRSTQAALSHFLGMLAAIEEVETVYVVTGSWDLMVVVRVRDHNHLSEVLFDRIWKVPGFQQSETMVVMHERQRTAARARSRKNQLEGDTEQNPPSRAGDERALLPVVY
jgi:DNA-binding Lrp family transcriptional regulator